MEPSLSIAIETSCRAGGVALGRGDELVEAVDFDASLRHAVQLIPRLEELLRRHGATPPDLAEVFVSTGPGGFTGVRIGVVVARTLAQALPALRCVAVPTPRAVAENARDADWDRLAVVLDAKDDRVYTATFLREAGRIVPAEPPAVRTEREFLAAVSRPVLLIGEGLRYHDLAAPGVTVAPADSPLHWPTAANVWRVGRRLASEGRYTEGSRLLPVYARRPEAVRLWENLGRPEGQA